MRYTTFFYGGINSINDVNEFELLNSAKPRFDGHIINDYALPKIVDDQMVRENLLTTNKGWDSSAEEVVGRYVKLFEYSYVRNILCIVYGGLEDGKIITELEKPFEDFYNLFVKENIDMTIAPVIAIALPRKKLPIRVPLKDYCSEDRFRYISQESIEALSIYFLDKYYGPIDKRDKYFSIDNRPVLVYFDLLRIGLKKKHGLDTRKISLIIESIRRYARKKYNINPYIISLENDYIDYKKIVSFDIDAITPYNSLPRFFDESLRCPIQEYEELVRMRKNQIPNDPVQNKTMMIPGVAIGFDSTCRVEYSNNVKVIRKSGYNDGYWYPLIPVVPWKDRNIEIFKEYLEYIIKYVIYNNLPFVNIGPFNELTQQCSYLPIYNKETGDLMGRYTDILREKYEIRLRQYEG